MHRSRLSLLLLAAVFWLGTAPVFSVRAAASGPPPGPPGVAGLKARAEGASVRLEWAPPPSDPAVPVVAYLVYRNPPAARIEDGAARTEDGNRRLLVFLPPGTTGYTDYRVLSGVTYAYTVAARLADGTLSGPAGPVKATPFSAGVSITLRLGQATAAVNGKTVTLDAPAQVVKGATMVPLRFVGTALGARVDYSASDKRVTAVLDGRTVVLRLGQTRAEVDGRQVGLTSPPVLQHGRTLVPVRFVAEAFGATVDYDPAAKRVAVTLPDKDATPEQARPLSSGAAETHAGSGAETHVGSGSGSRIESPAETYVLSWPGDADFFRCAVTPGRTYRIRATAVGSSAGTGDGDGPAPVLAVVDPGRDPGSAVAAAAGAPPSGPRVAELEAVAGQDETTLYLRVQTEVGGGWGGPVAYTVTVEDVTEPQDTQAGAVDLTPEAAAVGELHAPSDVDYLSFEAVAGRTYSVDVTALDGGRAGELAVQVLDAAGTVLVRGDTSASADASALEPDGPGSGPAGPATDEILWTCPADGRYYLTVGSLDGGYGPYTVTVKTAAPAANDDLRKAVMLTPDHTAYSAWLTSGSAHEWFSFPVSRGRRYYVQTDTGTGAAVTALTLYGWDGGRLAAGRPAPGLGFPGTGCLATLEAPYDGLVFAEVSVGPTDPWADVPTGLGRYTISVTTTHPEDDGSPFLAPSLRAGAPAVARSLLEGDRDWFQAPVAAGLTYTVATVDLSPGCDTDVAVYDSSWRLLAANDDAAPDDPASRASWTAAAGGTVYICVTPVYLDDAHDGTGTYAVVFTHTGGGGPP